MKVLFLTPGAGRMYCGGCLHDHALVSALQSLGHDTLMIPLYLPPQLEDSSSQVNTPIFFNGVNVYLDQRLQFYRNAPRFLRKIIGSNLTAKLASFIPTSTEASEETAYIALSMLRGEDGNQARDLDELIDWLKSNFKPDVTCLSNSMLLGIAGRLKETLKCKVVCQFQGEDAYIESFPEPPRSEVWKLLNKKCKDVDLFIAPSKYSIKQVGRRLQFPDNKVTVVYNGINLKDFPLIPKKLNSSAPVIGYFARVCPEKGTELLVDAFIELHNMNRIPQLKLKIAGTLIQKDRKFAENLQKRIKYLDLNTHAEFNFNVNKDEKRKFYQEASIFSVPAIISEVFGLYVAEAMASGIPLILPNHGSFTELIEITGAGVLYHPNNPRNLANTIYNLLSDPERYNSYSLAGIEAAKTIFTSQVMAKNFATAISQIF
ncbi:MAG: glycosyltransferase family 4 protein [Verrucomicrobiae bacterium]|nr:glycosyltransferase family 4 protein [Verrucomicrobiae bacterium]